MVLWKLMLMNKVFSFFLELLPVIKMLRCVKKKQIVTKKLFPAIFYWFILLIIYLQYGSIYNLCYFVILKEAVAHV